MAIILIVLIPSDSKVTIYSKCQSYAHCLITHAYCLLNTCKVLESLAYDEKEVMEVELK